MGRPCTPCPDHAPARALQPAGGFYGLSMAVAKSLVTSDVPKRLHETKFIANEAWEDVLLGISLDQVGCALQALNPAGIEPWA